MEELNNCKQEPDETVKEFYQRLETITCQITSSLNLDIKNKESIPAIVEYVNNITLSRFIYHSHPKISQMLRWRGFDNLNSAYSAAIIEESDLKRTRDSKPCRSCKCNYNSSGWKSRPKQLVQNSKNCQYCKKSGHVMKDCFLKNRNSARYEDFNLRKRSQNIPAPKRVVEKSVNLNFQESPVEDTELEDSIRQLKVSEI